MNKLSDAIFSVTIAASEQHCIRLSDITTQMYIIRTERSRTKRTMEKYIYRERGGIENRAITYRNACYVHAFSISMCLIVFVYFSSSCIVIHETFFGVRLFTYLKFNLDFTWRRANESLCVCVCVRIFFSSSLCFLCLFFAGSFFIQTVRACECECASFYSSLQSFPFQTNTGFWLPSTLKPKFLVVVVVVVLNIKYIHTSIYMMCIVYMLCVYGSLRAICDCII